MSRSKCQWPSSRREKQIGPDAAHGIRSTGEPGYRALTCQPDNFDPVANILYRDNGGGTASRRVRRSRRSRRSRGKRAAASAFADYDGDRFRRRHVRRQRFGAFVPSSATRATAAFEEVFRTGRRRQASPRDGKTSRRHGDRSSATSTTAVIPMSSSSRPVERTLSALSFSAGDAELPRRQQRHRHRRDHAAPFRLEHAPASIMTTTDGTTSSSHRDRHVIDTIEKIRAPPRSICRRRCCCATTPAGSRELKSPANACQGAIGQDEVPHPAISTTNGDTDLVVSDVRSAKGEVLLPRRWPEQIRHGWLEIRDDRHTVEPGRNRSARAGRLTASGGRAALRPSPLPPLLSRTTKTVEFS